MNVVEQYYAPLANNSNIQFIGDVLKVNTF